MDPEENIKVDPMQLEEGYFQQDEIADELAFQEQFKEKIEQPPAGFTENTEGVDTPTGDEIKFDAEGNPIEAKVDDPAEPFKFDETLADAEKAELLELNSKLGTNFEDLATLKSAINKQDTAEESTDIQKDRDLIGYLDELSTYSDRKIVEEDLKISLQKEGKDIYSQAVIDEIQEEADKLEDNGTLKYAARTVRDGVTSLRATKKANVDTFDNKQKVTKEQATTKVKEDTQSAINEIFKAGDFMGIKPTREDLLGAYADVTKNKHIDHLRANPREAIEYALFKKYKGEIQKKLGKPDFKAGVKNTLEQLGMEGSQQTGSPGTETKEDSQEKKSYFEKFIQ